MSLSAIARRFLQRIKPIKKKGNQDCNPKNNNKFNLAKIHFNLSEYNKYGLYTEDLLCSMDPDVKEAINRLPKDVYDARTFRSMRAMHLHLLKTYLPKEKWITFEQDREYRYLEPYIEEVRAEKKEIQDFGCTNYSPKAD